MTVPVRFWFQNVPGQYSPPPTQVLDPGGSQSMPATLVSIDGGEVQQNEIVSTGHSLRTQTAQSLFFAPDDWHSRSHPAPVNELRSSRCHGRSDPFLSRRQIRFLPALLFHFSLLSKSTES